jgi:tetratricopeptide (TPR) repeat protein
MIYGRVFAIKPGVLSFFLRFVVGILAIGVLARPVPSIGAGSAKDGVGRIVSLQGTVQARRGGENNWVAMKLDDQLYPGTMIRVLENSRAALLLQNGDVIRLDQNTTMTLPEAATCKTIPLDFLSGAAIFFSRFPYSLRIRTPFVNSDIEGTEFLEMVSQSETFISVYEGKVVASNRAGTLAVGKGQSAAAERGMAPSLRAVAHPRNAVNWALYYPPIPEKELGGQVDAESLRLFRKGDLAGAFGAFKRSGANTASPASCSYAALLYLTVGRVQRASSYLQKALSLDPHYSYALSLQSLMALVENKKDEALELAEKAVSANVSSPAARIALSYVQQARFDLDGALASTCKAAALAPGDGLVWARVSELWLSKGYLDKSLEAARKSVALNPELARPRSVLGYAYLTQIRIEEAKRAFREAIRLNSADPLPRLGLGLALIRGGDLCAGRTEIEIAAMLDPSNSLIRSYLGKAYFDEKRDVRACWEFELAKELDPQDPTPWFYSAIEKETQNRPVEALGDLQESIRLNNNRAVYRSRLLLDEDLAARSASLARIYSDLGFDRRAMVEAWNSLYADPANYSAHRFLSDAYATQPRYDYARMSELLQSQLLQPLNINPVQPQMQQNNLLLPQTSGPANPSFSEYNALFTRNQANLLVAGAGGQLSTIADETIASGIYDRYSLSLGQYHYETDGAWKNGDIRKNLYETFFQTMVTPSFSLLADYRTSNIRNGDLFQQFTPYTSVNREDRDAEFARIGFREVFNPNSCLIGHLTWSNLEDIPTFYYPSATAPFLIDITSCDQPVYNTEAEYIYRSEIFNIIAGGGVLSLPKSFSESMTMFTKPPVSIVFVNDQYRTTQREGYLYSYLNWPEKFHWTVGVSAVSVTDIQPGVDQQQLNPKLGLAWNLFSNTTIRATGFRTLSGVGNNPGSWSLETLQPTQIAGFNQFFDATAGTDAWTYGVGVDQRLGSNVFAGLEYSQRDLSELDIQPDGSASTFDSNEKIARAYLYWSPQPWVALCPEYLFENRVFAGNTPQFDWNQLNISRFIFGLSFFHPSGFFAQLKPTLVLESGHFFDSTSTPYWKDSDFFVLNAAIGYRLPKRLGFISIEAGNLFNKSFKFEDISPFAPTEFPQQWIIGKVTLFF